MEESRVLESAIKTCKLLEKSLRRSITEVRRLNIRYNVDWIIQNYSTYMANIWSHLEKPMPKTKPVKLCKTPNNLNLTMRSSQEMFGKNRKINFKFIKIKRGIEAMVLQLQHAIDIANRQRNFIHFNYASNGPAPRTLLCCH